MLWTEVKKISFVVGGFLLGNRVFDEESDIFNRDNCAMGYIMMKKKFAEAGFDFSTCDINPPEKSEHVIFLDPPRKPQNYSDNLLSRSFLILSENVVVKPNHWDQNLHRRFKMVFTWSSELAKKDGYCWITHNIPGIYVKFLDRDLAKKDKLCTLISANKHIEHPLELYSERVKAIKWFEMNHADAFDLYGFGWSITSKWMSFADKLSKYLKMKSNSYAAKYLSAMVEFLKKKNQNSLFKVYAGEVNSKISTFRRYRFSICYENAKDIPGYVSEKIFDSMQAGCVPIYYGANDIEIFIPKTCWVDFREFSSYEELYLFISKMSDENYLGYIEAIESFLQSKEAKKFSCENLSCTVVDEVLGHRN